MGYFSEHDISARSYRQDHSIPREPWDILLDRLEALEDRLEALGRMPQRWEERICFEASQLRAILPEHLESASDVRKAIALVKADLAERYGICLEMPVVEECPAYDEVTPLQISFADLLPAA